MNKDLERLLQFESKEIELAFQKASIEGRTTPQEIAVRREEIVISFLRKYFPFPYRIVKGNVIDSEGRRSDSIDCLILNPAHPYTIDYSNKYPSIIFADGVDFAIEIKPDLTSKKEIQRALKQIQSVKQLVRKRVGVFDNQMKNQQMRNNFLRIPGIIFSNSTYKNSRTLISHIVDYYVENHIPEVEQFDLMVINQRMVVFNYKIDNYISIDAYRGLVCNELGEYTMMMFLLLLNKMPRSEIEIGENILRLYLDDTSFSRKINVFIDLNERLIKNDQYIHNAIDE